MIQYNYEERDKVFPTSCGNILVSGYVYTDGLIPLQIALESRNHRMVNLILKYMSDINYAAVTQISDIFDDLLIYQDFVHYLEECTFNTHQMINK